METISRALFGGAMWLLRAMWEKMGSKLPLSDGGNTGIGRHGFTSPSG